MFEPDNRFAKLAPGYGFKGLRAALPIDRGRLQGEPLRRAGFRNFGVPWVAFMALLLTVGVFPFRASPSVGQASSNAHIDNPPNKPSQPPKATLSEFSWLEGKWQGRWGPRVAEQVWTAPRGGQMLGLSRIVADGKPLVIELFSLSETPEGVALKFRHFTPALAPWEQSDPGPVTMKLEELGAKSAVFANPRDGQPRLTILTRIDPDTYISKSEMVPAAGGPHSTEITYHRQK